MINSNVQICNPTKINAFTSNVDQGNGIVDHITFKRKLPTIKHVVHIPFIDLHCCYEITNKLNQRMYCL
jgi:hypothetical protein